MLKKKEVIEILSKFADKCTRINPNIKYNDCMKIGVDIISNINTKDTRSLIRILHYEIVKLNRIYHRPIVYKRNIDSITIEAFIKKVDSKLLDQIRQISI